MTLIDGSSLLYVFLRLVELALLVTMTIFWLRSMQRALEACHPLSRNGEPGMVWLTFIPVFGLVWQFIATTRVSEALAREYHRRGWHSEEGRPGLELGTIACVTVTLVFIVRGIWQIHPGIGFIGTLAISAFMYRHLDRLNAYRERLEKEPDLSMQFGQNTFAPGAYAGWPPPPGNVPPFPQQSYGQPPFPPPPAYPSYPPPPAYPSYPPPPAGPNFVPPPANYPPPADPNFIPPPPNYPPPPSNPWMPPPNPWATPPAPDLQQPPPPQQPEDPMKRWMPKEDNK